MARFTLAALDAILADTPEPRPTVAIETGTWWGDTTALLTERFEWVQAIEIDQTMAAHVAARLCGQADVWEGDSGALLPEVLGDLDGHALLYLDAHWWPGVADNADNPFPLWAELAAAVACPAVRVVVVDDVLNMGNKGVSNPGWHDATVERIVAAMGTRVERWAIMGDQLVAWWA